MAATFTNPTERPMEFLVRAHISQGSVLLMREINTRLALAPAETRPLQWTVTPEDAAYGRLVLVRVHALRNPPLPYRQASCGILVVSLTPLTGNQIAAVALAASLLGMGVGARLWAVSNRPLVGRPREAAHVMAVLAGIVLVGVTAGFFGWWGVGVLVLAFTVLFLGIVIGHFIWSS